MLDKIASPADLRRLPVTDLEKLSSEIRRKLLEVVAANGGHLAPNLGVVELTIALHYIFNTPDDKLVWDVGHQGYVHKLLTGRGDIFKSLRQTNGCLGFLSREESPEFDVIGAGHAGTAISAALGLAVARDRRGSREKVVAVVGDGSLNCGISLEGLNNISEATKDLIIILNDNKMSISQNVGAIPRYLNRIISGQSYNRFKTFMKNLFKWIPGWSKVIRKISRLEEATKSLLVPGVFFEELGIRYIGPIDGHDFQELIRTIDGVKNFRRPVIVHVITEKGHGYPHAEAAPEKFHGLSSFDPDTGICNGDGKDGTTFSKAFGMTMEELAEPADNLAVITAAMRSGTGLKEFSEKFPGKFHDVGIAEEHAVVFAAGLAAGGIRPVVAIYATFLQRALDCVFHDICLQNLPVIICCDRSGIVDDGPTHHGINDLGFLRALPNLSILSPKNETELRSMIFAAWQHPGPTVIRYPRGSSGVPFKNDTPPVEIPWGKAEVVKNGNDLAVWAFGRETQTAVAAAKILEEKHGLSATVVNSRFLKPLDEKLLFEHAAKMRIVTIEDHQTRGGLAAEIDELLINAEKRQIIHFGWGHDVVPHGNTSEIRKAYKLTPEAIAEKIAAAQTQ